MRITNKYGLPETFLNILERPAYTKGKVRISATELINSPQIVQLKAKHDSELETDVVDNIWSIFGTAVHGVLEHGKGENHIVEERLFIEHNGWSISGAIDLQTVEDDGVVIQDYKVTGAWSVMNEKEDWVRQQNIYAWLVEKVKGVKVKKIQIVAIIRDWSRRDAASREGYPITPVVVLDLDLWPFEKREAYIDERIKAHAEAALAEEMGDDLPECTPEQMWTKPTYYAVMKEGSIRAKKVFESKQDAQDLVDKSGKGHYIETRPGENTRCNQFCPVSNFCKQKERNEKRAI
jgi:hypothetical protein